MHDPSGHFCGTPFTRQLFSFNGITSAYRRGLTIPDFAFSRVGLVRPVRYSQLRHSIIQQAEQDAPVGDAVKAAIVLGRSELGATLSLLQTKGNPHAHSIVRAADEAMTAISS